MKRLKITSAMLSAVMCMSMLAAPVTVIADEAAAPEETQATEVTKKEETKETEKLAPKETEKPAETEKSAAKETEEKKPESTEKETEASEKTEPSETEKQETEATESQKPSETEKQEPETTVKETEPSEKTEPSETEKAEPETSETQEATQPEETAPEETVPEVKPEKGPVTTTRRKAKKEVSIYKDKDNTCFGTDRIAKPVAPSSVNSAWSGSFVYFGKYEDAPIRFRVLSPRSTAYQTTTGNPTLFLDSDETLINYGFGYPNKWDGSALQKLLNSGATSLFNRAFKDNEQKAIAVSKGTGGLSYANGSSVKERYGSPVSINDRLFILDAAEMINPNYGYSSDPGKTEDDWKEVKNRKKTGVVSSYWVRSAAKVILPPELGGDGNPVTDTYAGDVDKNGDLHYHYVNDSHGIGVAPALNIDLSAILFSTAVSGELGKAGTEYKLTLNDPNLRIEIPSVKKTSITGNTVTVHYRLNGTNNENVNRVSVLIRRRTNWNILLYEALTVSSISSGKGTFTLPSSLSLEDWGAATDVGYDVFILAEQTFGSQTTDYASELVSVDKPVERNLTVNPYIAYYKQDGTGPILDQEGESGTVSTNMTKVGTGDVVTVGATPKSGYSLKKIEWRNGVAGSATDITTKASFTVGDKDPYVYVYFQKLNPDEPVKYQVHYSILNENGSVDDSGKCGTVVLNKTEAESGEKITVTVTPNSGYELYQIAVCDANLNDSVNITATKSFTVKNYDPYVYVMFIRERQSNPLTASGRTAKVKYKKLRKKKQTVARAKVMNVSKAQGNVTYKLTGVKRGKSKKYKKYFTINAKTGNVTIKKKLKKGTYKVTCTVSAAGNGSYKAGTKSVTFKIKVK